MTSEYRLKRRVLWYETDAAGIVHFSNFFRYMEEAEHAMWREAGISIESDKAEVGWPRVSASFEFHRPLRFEDEFEVWIRVAAISEKTIRYITILSMGEAKIATGTHTIVCISKSPASPMRPVPIPPEILARFHVAPGVDE